MTNDNEFIEESCEACIKNLDEKCEACAENGDKRCQACQKQSVNNDCDPDSSPNAWEYYKIVYEMDVDTPNTPNDNSFKLLNKLTEDKIDLVYTLVKSDNRYIAITSDETFPNFGGDCIFNFSYDKYKDFKEIIGNDPEDMAQLKRCAQNHHSFLNFSLMPRTGGLNNTKGTCYDDPILFWSKLNEYLDIPLETRKNNLCVIFNKPYEIFNHATYPNLKAIKLFLDQFESINDYLKKVYFIEEDNWVNIYKDFSQCERGSFDWLKSYMNLAEKYWAKRYNRLILENGKGNGKGLKCFFVASDSQPVVRGTRDQPYFKIFEKDENLKI